MLVLILNAIGSLGDMYFTFEALRVRGPVYFGDTPGAKPGESGSWYLPAVS